ncbi:hypothetical protein RSOLAG22IIIB_05772 [Rhizoctonia solani]|uniref:Tet-like 2OG-Fe(II) oxygenase domain-containing protein n=1 Tax=Rhizoctonia solani TaxID=456999 RepID=A0A0K6G9Q0_9AGAM|nr:unnamed protein product [Rhizoctonia solani]CUA75206.1 hypothetical protein RSOLAG22IIIB_05772 [Rhizoctonia solani]
MDTTVSSHLIVQLLDRIKSEAEKAALLKDIDYIEDAVFHILLSVTPSLQVRPPAELLFLMRYFKQYFNNAVDAYEKDQEFEHYFNYFLGIGYDIHPEMTYDKKIEILKKYQGTLKEEFDKLKREKHADTRRRRNARLRELSNQLGLRAVGHVDDGRMPFDVLCIDAYTHKPLDNRTMLINGVDNDDPEAAPLPPLAANIQTKKSSNTNDPTVPKPARDSPFPQTGFVSKDMLLEAKFKLFSCGTVYGFAHAPNGSYSMVWAVQFSPIGSFNEVEQQAVDVFIDYMALAQDQAYKVEINRAQNGNKARKTTREVEKVVDEERHGVLLGGGWRPGRKAKEAAAEYSPQTRHDWHNPDRYFGYHEKQEQVSIGWIVLHERLSPYAVMKNIETLADTAVPLFGYHDSDISVHGPSLGSNMSVSMNDESGRNFANSMHVDQDIDSLPQYYGKIFTFGQWIHTKNGKLVEGPELREAIPDGYFALPGYRVAFDLGAAAVVTAIWRGGLDLHGTTTSRTNPESGITRWGMSIQTNRKLPRRIQSGKGAIFGAYDKLRAVYEVVCGE